MSEPRLDPRETDRAVRQATAQLDQLTEEERRRVLQEEIDRGVAEELAQRRAVLQRQAEAEVEELTRDTREQEANNARRKAPGNLLLLILIFLILYLIAAATGQPDIISFPRSRSVSSEPLPSVLGDGASTNSTQSGSNAGDVDGIGSVDQTTPEIGERFREFYNGRGGEPVFGKPISQQMVVNGRTVQWFERARLEEWPEHAGTPYNIQSGRLGVEFTKGIVFPAQGFFVSRPDLRYYGETTHGVAGRFLQFWESRGALDILGFPISDEVQERLPYDGQAHSVQYFERGRLEYYPELAGTGQEVQIGLLGRALYLNESKPDIISAPQPTPVALP